MDERDVDLVREIVREVMVERDRLAAGERQAQQQAEQEQLAAIRRSQLTPKQTSDLIDRVGYERYMQIPWDDQPRDDSGRFRRW